MKLGEFNGLFDRDDDRLLVCENEKLQDEERNRITN